MLLFSIFPYIVQCQHSSFGSIIVCNEDDSDYGEDSRTPNASIHDSWRCKQCTLYNVNEVVLNVMAPNVLTNEITYLENLRSYIDECHAYMLINVVYVRICHA